MIIIWLILLGFSEFIHSKRSIIHIFHSIQGKSAYQGEAAERVADSACRHNSDNQRQKLHRSRTFFQIISAALFAFARWCCRRHTLNTTLSYDKSRLSYLPGAVLVTRSRTSAAYLIVDANRRPACLITILGSTSCGSYLLCGPIDSLQRCRREFASMPSGTCMAALIF